MTAVHAHAILSPTVLGQLEHLYTFRGRAEVLDWIEAYPFLIPLLLEAPEKIRAYFPAAPLALQMDWDPEESGLNELIIHIGVGQDEDEGFEKLHMVGEDWWVPIYRQAQMKMNIAVAYYGL